MWKRSVWPVTSTLQGFGFGVAGGLGTPQKALRGLSDLEITLIILINHLCPLLLLAIMRVEEVLINLNTMLTHKKTKQEQISL